MSTVPAFPPNHTAIIQPTTCKLCGKRFTQPPGVDLTRTTDERTNGFISQLVTHLTERHPQDAKSAMVLGAEYAGMLKMSYFNMSGNVEEQREKLRKKIHRITRRVYVPDDKIDARVREVFGRYFTVEELARMFERDELGSAVVELLRRMRDVLTESVSVDPTKA
jgi:hypothetical protein